MSLAEILDRWREERKHLFEPGVQMELFDKNPGPWTLDDEKLRQ